jgi:hypothetical protein
VRGRTTLPGVEQPQPPSRRVTLAAAIVGLQAVALLGYGGYLVVQSRISEATNDELAAELPIFFLVLGALVALVAVGLARRSGFAYGAAVAVELLALPIAWEMAQERFWAGAVPVTIAAATALWALWSLPGRAEFGRDVR